MKRYTIEYLPFEARQEATSHAVYSIYDNDTLAGVGILSVLEYNDKYRIERNGEVRFFTSLTDLLKSIDNDIVDFDYPDELYALLGKG